ncbi:helix-turn-helix domain-containing protein, partial [Escherichia coli]|uniref:helix-turn-helix domain-containing protein n=1 Tax=Escherichia coli TaxID=562 RepID=UPI00186681C6
CFTIIAAIPIPCCCARVLHMGYENIDHFAKLFLRHVGCSPSDYRRQFKNCFAEQEILSEFPQPVSLVG